MIILLLLLIPDVPQIIIILAWIYAGIGVLLSLLAVISFLGTDPAEEYAEAMSRNHHFTEDDFKQMDIYDARAKAFAIHTLLCLTLGLLGFAFGRKYVPIPSEPR